MLNTETIKAYAKINLSLYVGGPRDDGYHPIYSVFQKIDLYDELVITKIPEKKLILSCNSKDVPLDQHNILMTIFDTCFSKIEHGFSVSINKVIPLGGGLGGGSTNAASFLWYLNSTQGWGMSLTELAQFSLSFGSDIPFFFNSPLCLVEGIGDKITPIADQLTHFYVIIVPPIHCHTKEIYSEYDTYIQSTGKSPHSFPTSLVSVLGKNDLKKIVFSLYSQFGEIEEFLTELGCVTYMSGSGATLFSVFDSEEDATRVSDLATSRWPDYFIRVSRPVDFCFSDD